MINCNLISLTRERHQQPIAIGMHTHTHDEIVYFISGVGTTTIRDKCYNYVDGSFAYYKAGTVHDEINKQPANIIWFHFDNFSGIELREGLFFDRDGELLEALKKLKHLWVSNYEFKDKLVEAALSVALSLAAEFQNAGENEKTDINWQQIIEYIDESYTEKIDFSVLAKKYGYSYDRFRHLFKERFGKSPYAYITELRMEMAKRLLLNAPDFNVTYIAYECGFENSSSFCEIFKKHFGTSPHKYRKNN